MSLYIILSLVCLQLLSTIYYRYRPDLRNLPGPSLAKWTNLWRLHSVFCGHAHLDLLTLHRKHGKIVRIGPTAVSISDPSAIPIIYDSKDTFKKTAFYPLQSIIWNKRREVNVFSTRDVAQHTATKRRVASAYNLDALLKMEGGVDDCGRLLMRRMRKAVDEKKVLDLGAWLLYYAFDVVGEITFSEKFGFLETGTDLEGMVAGGHFAMIYFATIGQIPWIDRLLLGNPLLPYLLPIEKNNPGLTLTLRAMQHHSTTTPDGQVQMKEGHAGNDMLSRWASLQAKDPLKMDYKDVMVALGVNIFAGADTTAVSLRAILYYLVKNPPVMQKLLQELDTAADDGKMSEPPTDRQVREHLPYMNAVIKEALRMHPAVGLPLERHVPPSGVEISGHYLSGGTIVGINPWTVHYDADVFPNPYEFRPERWFEHVTGKEHLASMERSFFAFGAGSRMCMGRHLSMIEMRKIVPRILREFEIGFEEEDAEWTVNNEFFTPQKMPLCLIRLRR